MRNLSDKNIAVLAIIIIVLTNGGSGVFTKIALRELTPEYYSFLRFFVSSLILLPLFLKTNIKFNKDLLRLVLVSLILTLNIFSFAYGIRLTTATVSSVLYVLAPVLVAIFSYLFIKEKMSAPKILGILLGISGAGLVILLPVIQKGDPFAGNLLGNIFILVGVISTALFTTISKKLHSKFSPIQITTVFSLTTCFLMFILSLPNILNNPKNILSMSQDALFSVIFVGAICTALFYLLHQYAIKHGSPLIASTVLFLGPFSTIIWAGIILGEKLTPLLSICGVLVLFGTYLIVKSSKKDEIDIEP